MIGLLVLAAIWLLVAPFIVLGKIGSVEESLRELRREMERMAAARPLAQKTASPIESAPEEAPVVPASSAYDATPNREEVTILAAEPAKGLLSEVIPAVVPPEPDEEISRKPAQEPVRSAPYQPPVQEERKPGVIALAFQKFSSWLLTEGNIWVCAGVLLFLVGFGLLFSYAIQRGVMTLEMRLAGAAVTGLAMTWFGFRLRERRRAYALTLQGGGVGVLYLVVLAAAKLPVVQPILPPAFSVIAMLVLSVFTVLLATLQDYQPLAAFAILGGFAAPVLVSAGSRNYAALFSIYTLLNFEILALSLKRDWRLLARMGFILSISVGTAWGMSDWKPELFNSVEPFLLVFFATYTLIASAVLNKNHISGGPDLLLAVSATFGFFFLQMKTSGHFRYGMALTCLGLGLWHLLFGAWLQRRERRAREESGFGKTRFAMSSLYMSLCLLFSNLVVVYTFDNSTASAVWAVEGAFLMAAACRTGSCKALLAGIALHAAALPFFCRELYNLDWSSESRLSPFFVSGVLFALSLLCSGFCASRFRPSISTLYRARSGEEDPLFDKWEEALQRFLSVWGELGEGGGWARGGLSWTLTVLGALCWWVTLYDQVPRLDVLWFSLFSAACVTALIGSWLSARFNWKAARFLLAFPVVWACFHALFSVLEPFLLTAAMAPAPIRHIQLDAFVYAVCAGGSLYILRKAERTVFSPVTMFMALLSGLFLAESAVQRTLFFGNWGVILSVLPVLALFICVRRVRRSMHYADVVSIAGATGIFLCLRGWRFFISFWRSGITAGGTFIPLLNPLELWQAFILAALFLWIDIFFMDGRKFREWPKLPKWVFGALVFAWINQMAVRVSWHYWIAAAPEVTYSLTETLRTASCQALIAIVWGVLGLGSILYGQKTRSRDLWYAGAGLIAADMVKLFLVDLNRSETLVRITAFLVLGGLALLIGWIAPLPPKKESDAHAQ